MAIDHGPDGEEVETSVWLNEKNAPKWILTQSSIHMPYYGETLVLIKAARCSDSLNSMNPTLRRRVLLRLGNLRLRGHRRPVELMTIRPRYLQR